MCEILLKANVATDEGQWPKWNVNTEQRDEIGVAVQSLLWVRVELMAW